MRVSHEITWHGARNLILATVLLAACSSTEPTEQTGTHQTTPFELVRNRQRWARAAIHDYEFDFWRGCFCTASSMGPVRITVRQGVVTAVERIPSSAVVPSPDRNLWPSIDAMFDEIQTTLATPGAELEVEYDVTLGYPRTIVVNRQQMGFDGGHIHSAGSLHRSN